MDRKGADAEGGRGRAQGRCAGKLGAVVVVQNLLVLACLLLTLSNYIYKPPREKPEEIVHILVEDFKTLIENETLTFGHVKSNSTMLLGEGKDTISINCTGPYVWYMYVCYQAKDSRGTLELQVRGSRDPPVSSFSLNATHDAASKDICRGLHSLVYFRNKQVASVRLYSTTGFIFRNVTMGLTYLLGNICVI
uniref:TNF family profile domain-containing protein n=2 Tax=Nothobranchius pienaari TaxID=704102 RepID=A0A1A8L0D8_9TELE